jgi:hypothetical protein
MTWAQVSSFLSAIANPTPAGSPFESKILTRACLMMALAVVNDLPSTMHYRNTSIGILKEHILGQLRSDLQNGGIGAGLPVFGKPGADDFVAKLAQAACGFNVAFERVQQGFLAARVPDPWL